MEQLRLAIFGGFGYGDLGDEAMLSEYLRYITGELRMPRSRLFLLTADAEYSSSYHEHPLSACLQIPPEALTLVDTAPRALVKRGLKLFGKLALRHRLRALRTLAEQSDALIVTGGGVVNTRDDKGFSIKRTAAIVRFFRAHGVPIFMSGQTIGPLGCNSHHDRLAREIVKSVDCLTVRDSVYSRRYLEVIGEQPRELIETIDDASALNADFESIPPEIRAQLRPGDYLTFNVSEYTCDTAEKKVFCARLVDSMVCAYRRLIVFVAHTPHDFTALWEIFDLLPPESKRLVLVPDTRKWRAEQVKGLISRGAFAVGGRYHFIVFSATADVPFVGLTGNHYSYIKQDGFARAFEQGHSVLNPHDSFELDTVRSKIDEVRHKTLAISQRITYPLPSMIKFGEWLTQIYNSKPKTER